MSDVYLVHAKCMQYSECHPEGVVEDHQRKETEEMCERMLNIP